MYVLNQNIKGGGNITAFNAFTKRTPCNIAAEIGSSIVGAGSSLIGGILGKKSQSDANKTNLQIARETNASNQQLAEKQTNGISTNGIVKTSITVLLPKNSVL